MKVKELIKELKEYNLEAKINVIVNNTPYAFSLLYGTSDGVMKETCETVSFWIDELCKQDTP